MSSKKVIYQFKVTLSHVRPAGGDAGGHHAVPAGGDLDNGDGLERRTSASVQNRR